MRTLTCKSTRAHIEPFALFLSISSSSSSLVSTRRATHTAAPDTTQQARAVSAHMHRQTLSQTTHTHTHRHSLVRMMRARTQANKRQAREVGALPVLVHLLSSSQVPEVLSPVAGAICNLSMKCPENKAEFVRYTLTNTHTLSHTQTGTHEIDAWMRTRTHPHR